MSDRFIDVRPPIRVPRGNLMQEAEIARVVQLAAKQVGPDGRILILLDADDDCPAEVGPRILGWGRAARADRSISVVVAKREFEGWFLAASGSIAGRRELPGDLPSPSDPESIRDAKGWLGRHMGRRYSEVIDQAALAAVFDVAVARGRSPSFDKFMREFESWW